MALTTPDLILLTWGEIRDNYSDKPHHLRLHCPCGNTTTCRCSKEKTDEYGICPECAAHMTPTEHPDVEEYSITASDRFMDAIKLAKEEYMSGGRDIMRKLVQKQRAEQGHPGPEPGSDAIPGGFAILQRYQEGLHGQPLTPDTGFDVMKKLVGK